MATWWSAYARDDVAAADMTPCAKVANVASGHVDLDPRARPSMAERCGGEVRYEHRPERAGEIRHSLGSVKRLQQLLGFVRLPACKAGWPSIPMRCGPGMAGPRALSATGHLEPGARSRCAAHSRSRSELLGDGGRARRPSRRRRHCRARGDPTCRPPFGLNQQGIDAVS